MTFGKQGAKPGPSRGAAPSITWIATRCIDNQVKGYIPLVCDLKAILDAALPLVPARVSPCADWLAEIDQLNKAADTRELDEA